MTYIIGPNRKCHAYISPSYVQRCNKPLILSLVQHTFNNFTTYYISGECEDKHVALFDIYTRAGNEALTPVCYKLGPNIIEHFSGQKWEDGTPVS